MNNNNNSKNREIESSMFKVACPFYEGCKFGKARKGRGRIRCHGTVFYATRQKGSFVISYKCERMNRHIMFGIKDGKDRHIEPESQEYDWFAPQLRQIICCRCKRRIVDVHHIDGEALISCKCQFDRNEVQYSLKLDAPL